MDHLWLWTSAGVALGFVATCWAHLRAVVGRLQRSLIVERKLDVGQSLLDEIFTYYLERNAKAGRLNDKCYQMLQAYVRPLARWRSVLYERQIFDFKTYWLGWWPLWLTRSGDSAAKEGGVNTPHREFVVCRFIRWTIDFEKILVAAIEDHNRRMEKNEADTGFQRRFHVFQITGTASMRGPTPANNIRHGIGQEKSGGTTSGPIGWNAEDVGDPLPKTRKALDTLAISTEASQIVTDVRRWLGAKEWYRQRAIPWRRSWLLSGQPGTGKTALIRALAQDLDLPVFLFHLHTLTDRELIEEWRSVKLSAPSIAVFEDIDAVFQGRESKNECLSFDTLLNCLDGVEESDGVLTFVTSNRPESLDPALASATEATRPGRIDRVVHMGPLSVEGRLQICRRILPEHAERWGDLVEDGDGETGAQFVCRCRNQAEQLFWTGPRQRVKESSTHEVNGKHLTLVFEQTGPKE